ncbi:hypothetical protein PHYC_00030 [Phycisphaerales bacterium]|nr:hypothetical protein PHYC_00030 [Phycisphaerales bacterium]
MKHARGGVGKWVLALWLAGAAWVLGPAASFAQVAPPASSPGLSGGEVSVELDRFGVGGVARRGDWAGIRLRLKDNGSKQRQVLVRISSVDPDGDYPTYELGRTLNPGVEQLEWVYLRLPFRFSGGDSLTVSVYEAEEDSQAGGFRAGRLLSRVALQPNASAVLKPTQSIIGMMGGRSLGLLKYTGGATRTNEDFHPLGHECAELANGIKPAELPDRWMGLAPMEVLVWGEGDPVDLRGDRAAAVRDWVERGGHLVIILPQVGQTWTNPQSNELHEIMPLVAVQRNENVDLAPYRPLIDATIRKSGPPFPKSGVVHTFRKLAEVKPSEAMEILNGPDGRCVVARRLVGAGAVTLVGLDLNQTALSQGDLIDTEVFWHRVLGRRGKLTETETSGRGPAIAFGNRQPWPYDDDIAKVTSLTGQAAVGVLAGLVMFVAYWLIAGPLGYAALKARGQQRHAWVGFLAVTLVFTGVAWGGASLLRPGRVHAKHLTFVDHVYGQPLQRARMWASVLIPWYGAAKLSVQGSEGQTRSLSAIVAWDAPQDENPWSGFPDSRAYIIDARRPDTMTVPSRSTSKRIQADWAGGPTWEMPRPTGPDGTGTGELTLNPDWVPGSSEPLLKGHLIHGLPAKLEDVTLIVVRQQVNLRRPREGTGALDGGLLVVAHAFSLAEWVPGPEGLLDLGIKTMGGSAADRGSTLASWLNGLRPSLAGNFYQGMPTPPQDLARMPERLTALALFPLLPPPELDNNSGNGEYIAQRRATHGWDLGRWFTQPCVIIIGQVHGREPGVESPVPLLLDGERIPTQGRTVVRWVYPLPTLPPRFPAEEETSDPATTPDPGAVPAGDGGDGGG